MKVARAAGIVSTVAAIVVIAGAFARFDPLVYAAAVVVLIAGAVVVRASKEAAAPEPVPVVEAKKNAEPTGSVLLATLRNAEEGSERLLADLHRILAGIVSDERGKIDRVEPHTIVALFSRGEHVPAAVQAAQRMLSNVDALSRRLGQPLTIAIAVHAGPRGAESVNVAARIQEAATESVPILVTAPAAAVLGDQLEKVDTVSADGWSLDVFTFPPAQKRLPGF